MSIAGTFGIHPPKYRLMFLPIEWEDSILNTDFFLRYLHMDAKASSHIVSRVGIKKIQTHIGLTIQSLDTNLYDYLETLPDDLTLEKTKNITKKIAEALHFIDNSDVVYPGLNPKRILLSSDGETVKLCNFEQAYFKGESNDLQDYKVEDPYKSPEIILEIPSSSDSNVWALGLLINQMLSSNIYTLSVIVNRVFHTHIEIPDLIVFHSFLTEKSYPNDLINQSSEEGKQALKESLSSDLEFSTPLTEIIRNAPSLQPEDPKKIEDLLDLLSQMFKYTDRATIQEVLEHPFLTLLSKKRKRTNKANPLEEKKIPFHELILRNPLGSGTFGEIFEGTLKRKTYAVKINKEKVQSKKDLLNEDRKLRLLQRDPEAASCILNRLASYQKNDKIHLVLERMKMGLHTYIQQKTGLSLEKTRQFTKQLGKGLLVLFRMNVIHLDLKPANVLVSLDENTVKISDFGTSCFKDKACHPNSFYKQSRWWRSPEDILEIPYTAACDIWSLGAIIPEMLTNYVLFKGSSEKEMIAFHHLRLKKPYPEHLVHQGSKSGQEKFTKAKETKIINIRNLNQIIEQNCLAKSESLEQSRLLIDLVEQALEYDPSKRITPKQLLDHPFLKEEIS